LSQETLHPGQVVDAMFAAGHRRADLGSATPPGTRNNKQEICLPRHQDLALVLATKGRTKSQIGAWP
jgi:hypothetical protein